MDLIHLANDNNQTRAWCMSCNGTRDNNETRFERGGFNPNLASESSSEEVIALCVAGGSWGGPLW